MTDIYKQIATLPADKRQVLEMMLMEQGVDLSQLVIIPEKRTSNEFPLSYSQQRLWFLDKLEPGSPLYNICSALRIKGQLNLEAIEKSLHKIIERHEVLRTTFTEKSDGPKQVIQKSHPIKNELIDLTQTHPTLEELNQLILEESLKPFDLTNGPLLRVKTILLKDSETIVILTLHHIVSDNWSTGILIQEMMTLYTAFVRQTEANLSELIVQYADFSVWQRKWLSGKTLEKQLSYWKNKLTGIPPILDIPLDFPRPAYQTYKGDYKLFEIREETSNKLLQVCEKLDATIFQVLFATFQILLYKYSGQEDFCVGTPIANRNRSETESLIGFFINTLVIRASLEKNPTFKEILTRVKETTIEAYDHQDLPFETLVEKLDPKRDMSHSPLFQVMFVLNNAPLKKLELPDVEIEILEIENKTAKFELIFNFIQDGNTFKAKVEYNTDLYKSSTIENMIRHFQIILDNVLQNINIKLSNVSLLTTEEKTLLLEKWSHSERQIKNSSLIPKLIYEQSLKNPDKTAVVVGDESISYAVLEQKINNVAGYLVNQKKVNRGEIIAVLANRSAEMIYGMLGVMRAGATYLPLDPNYPFKRLQFMIDDANANWILTKKDLKIADNISESQRIYFSDVPNSDTFTNQTEADLPAYIIYTSGTTGNPKGVLVNHQTIADHCLDMTEHFKISPEKNVLQFAALNFDAALEQILPTLIAGATLVLRADDIWPAAHFLEYADRYKLDVINLPTAYWNQLTEHLHQNSSEKAGQNIQTVIIGGDAMKLDTYSKWSKTNLSSARLINAYGPTEAVITAATFNVSPNLSGDSGYNSIPIGKPCANRSFLVLDKYGNLQPPGLPGELHIAGENLAKGYHNRPEITDEKFIKNPFAKNQIMYKTGDLVKYSDNGNLEFLGRVDQQLKIRGFRIEPSEVEAVLLKHTEIDQVIVFAGSDATGEKTLFAYFIPRPGANPAISDLRKFLQKQLPEFMIPSFFIQLSDFPMLPSGKVNKYDLPVPDDIRSQVATEFIAPRTDTEKVLAEIVSDILKIDKVGVNDSFFELGGHSMMATQVISRIREEFKIEVPLRSLFEAPTVAGIAISITEIQAEFEDKEDLSAMLDELDGLSEEEVKRLLEEEKEE